MFKSSPLKKQDFQSTLEIDAEDLKEKVDDPSTPDVWEGEIGTPEHIAWQSQRAENTKKIAEASEESKKESAGETKEEATYPWLQKGQVKKPGKFLADFKHMGGEKNEKLGWKEKATFDELEKLDKIQTVTEDGEEELDPISLETYKKQKFEWFTEQVDWEYDEDKEFQQDAYAGGFSEDDQRDWEEDDRYDQKLEALLNEDQIAEKVEKAMVPYMKYKKADGSTYTKPELLKIKTAITNSGGVDPSASQFENPEEIKNNFSSSITGGGEEVEDKTGQLIDVYRGIDTDFWDDYYYKNPVKGESGHDPNLDVGAAININRKDYKKDEDGNWVWVNPNNSSDIDRSLSKKTITKLNKEEAEFDWEKAIFGDGKSTIDYYEGPNKGKRVKSGVFIGEAFLPTDWYENTDYSWVYEEGKIAETKSDDEEDSRGPGPWRPGYSDDDSDEQKLSVTISGSQGGFSQWDPTIPKETAETGVWVNQATGQRAVHNNKRQHPMFVGVYDEEVIDDFDADDDDLYTSDDFYSTLPGIDAGEMKDIAGLERGEMAQLDEPDINIEEEIEEKAKIGKEFGYNKNGYALTPTEVRTGAIDGHAATVTEYAIWADYHAGLTGDEFQSTAGPKGWLIYDKTTNNFDLATNIQDALTPGELSSSDIVARNYPGSEQQKEDQKSVIFRNATQSLNAAITREGREVVMTRIDNQAETYLTADEKEIGDLLESGDYEKAAIKTKKLGYELFYEKEVWEDADGKVYTQEEYDKLDPAAKEKIRKVQDFINWEEVEDREDLLAKGFKIIDPKIEERAVEMESETSVSKLKDNLAHLTYQMQAMAKILHNPAFHNHASTYRNLQEAIKHEAPMTFFPGLREVSYNDVWSTIKEFSTSDGLIPGLSNLPGGREGNQKAALWNELFDQFKTVNRALEINADLYQQEPTGWEAFKGGYTGDTPKTLQERKDLETFMADANFNLKEGAETSYYDDRTRRYLGLGSTTRMIQDIVVSFAATRRIPLSLFGKGTKDITNIGQALDRWKKVTSANLIRQSGLNTTLTNTLIKGSVYGVGEVATGFLADPIYQTIGKEGGLIFDFKTGEFQPEGIKLFFAMGSMQPFTAGVFKFIRGSKPMQRYLAGAEYFATKYNKFASVTGRKTWNVLGSKAVEAGIGTFTLMASEHLVHGTPDYEGTWKEKHYSSAEDMKEKYGFETLWTNYAVLAGVSMWGLGRGGTTFALHEGVKADIRAYKGETKWGNGSYKKLDFTEKPNYEKRYTNEEINNAFRKKANEIYESGKSIKETNAATSKLRYHAENLKTHNKAQFANDMIKAEDITFKESQQITSNIIDGVTSGKDPSGKQIIDFSRLTPDQITYYKTKLGIVTENYNPKDYSDKEVLKSKQNEQIDRMVKDYQYLVKLVDQSTLQKGTKAFEYAVKNYDQIMKLERQKLDLEGKSDPISKGKIKALNEKIKIQVEELEAKMEAYDIEFDVQQQLAKAKYEIVGKQLDKEVEYAAPINSERTESETILKTDTPEMVETKNKEYKQRVDKEITNNYIERANGNEFLRDGKTRNPNFDPTFDKESPAFHEKGKDGPMSDRIVVNPVKAKEVNSLGLEIHEIGHYVVRDLFKEQFITHKGKEYTKDELSEIETNNKKLYTKITKEGQVSEKISKDGIVIIKDWKSKLPEKDRTFLENKINKSYRFKDELGKIEKKEGEYYEEYLTNYLQGVKDKDITDSRSKTSRFGDIIIPKMRNLGFENIGRGKKEGGKKYDATTAEGLQTLLNDIYSIDARGTSKYELANFVRDNAAAVAKAHQGINKISYAKYPEMKRINEIAEGDFFKNVENFQKETNPKTKEKYTRLEAEKLAGEIWKMEWDAGKWNETLNKIEPDLRKLIEKKVNELRIETKNGKRSLTTSNLEFTNETLLQIAGMNPNQKGEGGHFKNFDIREITKYKEKGKYPGLSGWLNFQVQNKFFDVLKKAEKAVPKDMVSYDAEGVKEIVDFNAVDIIESTASSEKVRNVVAESQKPRVHEVISEIQSVKGKQVKGIHDGIKSEFMTVDAKGNSIVDVVKLKEFTTGKNMKNLPGLALPKVVEFFVRDKALAEKITDKIKNNKNLDGKDIKAIQDGINKFIPVIAEYIIPQGFVTKEVKGIQVPAESTGVPKKILDVTHNKRSIAGETTIKGEKARTKENFFGFYKKDITSKVLADLGEAIGFMKDGSRNMNTRKNQPVKGLEGVGEINKRMLTMTDKMITNQAIRELLLEQGKPFEAAMLSLADGKPPKSFAKGEKTLDFREIIERVTFNPTFINDIFKRRKAGEPFDRYLLEQVFGDKMPPERLWLEQVYRQSRGLELIDIVPKNEFDYSKEHLKEEATSNADDAVRNKVPPEHVIIGENKSKKGVAYSNKLIREHNDNNVNLLNGMPHHIKYWSKEAIKALFNELGFGSSRIRGEIGSDGKMYSYKITSKAKTPELRQIETIENLLGKDKLLDKGKEYDGRYDACHIPSNYGYGKVSKKHPKGDGLKGRIEVKQEGLIVQVETGIKTLEKAQMELVDFVRELLTAKGINPKTKKPFTFEETVLANEALARDFLIARFKAAKAEGGTLGMKNTIVHNAMQSNIPRGISKAMVYNVGHIAWQGSKPGTYRFPNKEGVMKEYTVEEMIHWEHERQLLNNNGHWINIVNKHKSLTPEALKDINTFIETSTQSLVPKDLQLKNDALGRVSYSELYGQGGKASLSTNAMLNVLTRRGAEANQLVMSGPYKGKTVADQMAGEFTMEQMKEVIKTLPKSQWGSKAYTVDATNLKQHNEIINTNISKVANIIGKNYSKGKNKKTTKEVLEDIKTIDKAIELGRKINKKERGMSAWDFDDTLAYTKGGVRYTLPNPSGKPQPKKKVIFMAGGAGSGKSNVIKQLGLEKQGFKIVNQDISLEWLMKNHGLPKDMRDFTTEQRSQFGSLSHQARGIALRKRTKFQGKGDGVIVDGTGASLNVMKKNVKEFTDKGYDVQMMFVETSKDVAVARNKARKERSLNTKIVEGTWEKVQGNKKAYQELFGERFAEVNTDNLKMKDPMPPELVESLDAFTKGYIKARLNAGEFADKGAKLKEQGAEFDFAEFNVVTGGKKGPFFQKALDRVKKFGSEHQYIITARPPEAQVPIHEFLKSQGLNIPLENIKGLGNSTGEAKAMWMLEKFSEGYNDMYFADDALGNVKAVKDVLSQLDIKSNVQIARQYSRGKLSKDFNQIIEEVKGIGREKTYSEGRAKQEGARKGKWKWWGSSGMEDFQGLITYAFAGKGKKGEGHKKFFDDNLQKPYNRAYNEIHSIKQTMSNDYTALRKSMPEVTKQLRDKVRGSVYTVENAIRTYLWNKAGYEVPGMSKRDVKLLDNFVKNNKQLTAFAETLSTVTKLKEGYAKPKDYWLAETITGDLQRLADGHYRDLSLTEFKENREAIFGEWKAGRLIGENMNKIEAAYGAKHRENIEGMLYAMETGQNRPYGTDAITNKWMNWINNAGGTIMFFNVKSSALQTISNINYMNGTFNNPFAAAKAFANQPQYWKDFAKIFNSDMLLQRRSGLKINIEASELTDRLSGKDNKAQRALSYLLEKGFIPTKYADSFAISMGGATFYRNRVKSLMKEGISESKAEKQAWIEFTETTEATQQSSRPDFISAQQRSAVGRPILMFGNTPMQMFRRHKRRIQDIANNRGNRAENIMSAAYYGVAQTAIFSYLANAMFAKDEDDLEKEESGFNEKKDARFYETIIDSYLRGMGTQGATVSALKNGIQEFITQNKKDYNSDYNEVIFDLLNISPPIGSKIRKLSSAGRTWQYNEDVVKKMGFDIDNPMLGATANVISALTNVPLDRVHLKIQNLRDASNNDYKTWERIALATGLNRWTLGLGKQEAVIEAKEEVKEEKKIETKKKREIKKEEKKIEKAKKEAKVIEDNIKKQEQEKKEGKKDIKCAAVSKGGNRCKTTIEPGQSYCTIHEKAKQNDSGKKTQCKKMKQISKKKTERCGMMTSSKSGYCYYHD